MVPLLFHYVHWHYTRAIRDIIRIWMNFFWFFFNFFSIDLLLKTLFAPFNRLDEGLKKGFDISAWAESILVNLLMRVVGACLRTFLIFIGIVMLVLTAVFGSVMLVVWILAPLFVVLLVAFGLTFLAI